MDPIALNAVDMAIVVGYFCLLLGIGLFHARSQRDLDSFFMAHKSMAWVPVGVSLMAALNSGMDYINTPSVVIRLGWMYLLISVSWVIIYPYMFFIIIPMFSKLRLISIYEYLALRFDDSIRLAASVIFFFWRLAWMSSALYTACLALTVMLARPHWLVPMIVFLGILVTVYTMMGGMKAVIWNDFSQFVLMMTGLVVTLFLILDRSDVGWGGVMDNFFFPGLENVPNPDIDTTSLGGKIYAYFTIPLVLPGMILIWFIRLVGFTSDQVMIQRFSTARSMTDARKSFVITAFSDIAWMVLLFIVGIALATYLSTSEALPPWVVENPDRIFPYFITTHFPVGLTGLVLAAILAASLSSIDSAIHSMTTIAMVDFVKRIHPGGEPLLNRLRLGEVNASRILMVMIGILSILISINIRHLGTLFDVIFKLLGLFMGPMLAIFWLAMFTVRANAFSTLAGIIIGFSLTSILAFFTQVGSVWVAPTGLMLTFLTGYLLGKPGARADAARWTFRGIMANEISEKEVGA